MFNKKSLIVLMLIAILAIGFMGWGLLYTINTIYFNDIGFYGRFLNCEELPPSSEVTRIVEQHQETIKRIEEVNPDGIYDVVIDSHTCPGKAGIIFNYNTGRQRAAIKAIIDGETFFGVPYRLQNN